MTEPGHKFLVLRKVGATLRESCYALLRDVIIEMGCFSEWKIQRGSMSFEHVNGSKIVTTGLDEPEKIKSVTGVTSMWLEEATEFTHKDFTQLLLRVRGEKKHYTQYILSFNPISEYHWLKTKVIDQIEKLEGYKYVRSTYNDNFFMDVEDRKQLEELKITNPLYYQVYCLGEWGVEDKTGKFAYAFNSDKHEGFVEYNENEYTYLSFDFNVNPITCSVIQHIDGQIRVIEQIKLKDSNIYRLCDHIRAGYPDGMFIVTGDATGQATSALVKDKLNYYKVIKSELYLSDGQIQVPRINPNITENRVLINALLENYDVIIDKRKAQGLIYDLKYVEVDENNKLKKDNRNDEKQQADSIDCFRYYCNKFHRDFVRVPQKN